MMVSQNSFTYLLAWHQWHIYEIAENIKTAGKHLCASQRPAIIKTCEKPNKDKRFISNWRHISLLNFDLKAISKYLATRVKKVLLNLIDARQTAM